MGDLSNLASYEYEHRIIKPNGAIVHLMHYVQVIKDGDGQPLRLQGTSKDITEKKEQ